jgi:hypothetical protein
MDYDKLARALLYGEISIEEAMNEGLLKRAGAAVKGGVKSYMGAVTAARRKGVKKSEAWRNKKR